MVWGCCWNCCWVVGDDKNDCLEPRLSMLIAGFFCNIVVVVVDCGICDDC